MERPVTMLFMLMSVDGKISTGVADELDVDKDFPRIAGVSEGFFRLGRYVRTVGARAENERAYEKQRKYGQKLALHGVTS